MKVLCEGARRYKSRTDGRPDGNIFWFRIDRTMSSKGTYLYGGRRHFESGAVAELLKYPSQAKKTEIT